MVFKKYLCTPMEYIIIMCTEKTNGEWRDILGEKN